MINQRKIKDLETNLKVIINVNTRLAQRYI